MKNLAARFIFAALLLFGAASAASAAQDDVFLAQMKVVREINLGSTFEYEVESAGRGRAILKTPPYRLKVGEAINLFVKEGAKENGKPAYMMLRGDGARSFKEGFAAVKFGGGWDFIDKNGRLLRQGEFKRVWDFREGFALCALEKGYAFIGKDGKFLNTPLIYPIVPINIAAADEPIGFSEGVAIMGSRTVDDKEILILVDKTGAVTGRVDKSRVYWSRPFSEGLAPIASLGKYAKYGNGSYNLFAYVDKRANVVIPHQFEVARSFKEGLAAVSVAENANAFRGKWGFIDKSGRFVVEAKYEWAQSFSDGRAAVKNGGKWGFIDKNGNITANIVYDDVRSYSEGLAAVKRGGQWGFIDKNGQVVIKFIYGDAKSFANGLAPVYTEQVNKKGWRSLAWGYIDKTGKIVIEPKYRSAQSFSDGLALVLEDTPGNMGDKWKYINTKGQAALWFYMYEY